MNKSLKNYSIKKIGVLIFFINLLWESGLHVEAHQIESSLCYSASNLILKASYSNGQLAKNAIVKLTDPSSGFTKEIGRTNHGGELVLEIENFGNGLLELQIDDGPGHRDYLQLPLQNGRVRLKEVVRKIWGNNLIASIIRFIE